MGKWIVPGRKKGLEIGEEVPATMRARGDRTRIVVAEPERGKVNEGYILKVEPRGSTF